MEHEHCRPEEEEEFTRSYIKNGYILFTVIKIMIVNCRTFIIANISNNKLSVIHMLNNFEQVERNMRLIFLTHLVRHPVLKKLRMRTLKRVPLDMLPEGRT